MAGQMWIPRCPDQAAPVMMVIWIAPVALVAGVVVVAVSLWRGVDRRVIIERLALVGLLAALGAAAALTLQPLDGGFDAPRASNFNPLSRFGRKDALDNVLLFLPFGFFAAVWWRSKPRPVLWATGLAFSASFGIEMAQWVAPINRAASIHDIMSNTLGGFPGALAAVFVMRLVERSMRSAETAEMILGALAGSSARWSEPSAAGSLASPE